jgi:hypothetical protein
METQDNTPYQIVRTRESFNSCSEVVVNELLQSFDFTNVKEVASTYSSAISSCLDCSFAETLGLNPTVFGKLIYLASTQVAFWILDKTLSGIPARIVVDVSIDVARHELLSVLEHHLGFSIASPTLARRVAELTAHMGGVERQLTVRARFAARRARDGLFPLAHQDDVMIVSERIAYIFPEFRFQARPIAASALETACLWIYTLGQKRFALDEFNLGTNRLPSHFVAEAGILRFRHIMLTLLEDAFYRQFG